MKKFLLLSLALLLMPLSSSAGYSWAESRPIGDINGAWRVMFISPNGSQFIAAASDNMYISSDYGATWTKSQPPGLRWTDPAGRENWSGPVDSIASNVDGSQLIVSIGTGVYLSSDRGRTWRKIQPAGDLESGTYIIKVAASANGRRLFVLLQGGQFEYPSRLLVSADGGASWAETAPGADAKQIKWTQINIGRDAQGNQIKTPVAKEIDDWSAGINGIRSLVVSADGSRLLVNSRNRLYLSSDGGLTWSQTNPAQYVSAEFNPSQDPLEYYKSFPGAYGLIAMSADGRQLWAMFNIAREKQAEIGPDKKYRLYYSADSGATWSEKHLAWPASSFTAAGSGAVLAASVFGGRIYLSDDAGLTWVEIQPVGNANKNWQSVAVSDDGTHLLAGVYEGRIFTTVPPGASPSRENQIKPSARLVCVDTDRGRNAKTKGTVTVTQGDRTVVKLSDRCKTATAVWEAVCNAKAKPGYSRQVIPCGKGMACQNGACKKLKKK